MSKTITTLKSWSRVSRGHWKWYHSIEWYGFLLVFYSNFVPNTHHLYEIFDFKKAMTVPWAAPQVLNRVCLFPLPPLPSFPSPSLPSHPIIPSIPFPSFFVPGGGVPIPPTPSLPFPPLPLSLSPGSHPLNQLGGLGSAVSSPVGSGAKPQPTNDLVHI